MFEIHVRPIKPKNTEPEAELNLGECRFYFPTGSVMMLASNRATGDEIWAYHSKVDRYKYHAEITNQSPPCRHFKIVGQ